VVIRRAHLDRILGVASSLAVLTLCAATVHPAATPSPTSAALAAADPAAVVVGGPGDTGWG
jgi:hypothetical protein